MGNLNNNKIQFVSDRKNPFVFSFELLDDDDLLYIKAKNLNMYNTFYDFSFTRRDLDNLECSFFKPKEDIKESLHMLKSIFENKNSYKFSLEEKDDELTIIINDEMNIFLKKFEENEDLRKTKMFELSKSILNDKFINSFEKIDENKYLTKTNNIKKLFNNNFSELKIEKEIILNENFNIENITILENDSLCLNNKNSIKIYNLNENEFEFGFEMKFNNFNIKKIIKLIDNNILIFYLDENENNFLEVNKINKNNNDKIQNLEIDKTNEINDVIFLMCGKIILSKNLCLIVFNYKLKKKKYFKEFEIYVKNYNIKKIFEISNNLIVYSKTKKEENKEKIEFYDFLKKKITKNIKMKINNFLLINLDFLLCFNENEVFIVNLYKKNLVSKFNFNFMNYVKINENQIIRIDNKKNLDKFVFKNLNFENKETLENNLNEQNYKISILNDGKLIIWFKNNVQIMNV
jgi:hypothetical protein